MKFNIKSIRGNLFLYLSPILILILVLGIWAIVSVQIIIRYQIALAITMSILIKKGGLPATFTSNIHYGNNDLNSYIVIS